MPWIYFVERYNGPKFFYEVEFEFLLINVCLCGHPRKLQTIECLGYTLLKDTIDQNIFMKSHMSFTSLCLFVCVDTFISFEQQDFLDFLC